MPPENDDFLNLALIDINARARPSSVEELWNTLLSAPPFHPYADTGPEAIWRLSCPQDGFSLAIFERHDWISRRWGYVLWDHARLLDLEPRGDSLFLTPWEPAVDPVPRPEGPSEEEREASWRKRSVLYNKGCRGYWAEGDESRVRWPEERKRSPGPEEQLRKHREEEERRWTPGSLEDAKRYWEVELAHLDQVPGGEGSFRSPGEDGHTKES